jgi:hypothetical protein
MQEEGIAMTCRWCDYDAGLMIDGVCLWCCGATEPAAAATAAFEAAADGLERIDSDRARDIRRAIQRYGALMARVARDECEETIGFLRARVRELEGIVARHGRQGEAAIEAVVAMDAEVGNG